jgi:hypothetical protein
MNKTLPPRKSVLSKILIFDSLFTETYYNLQQTAPLLVEMVFLCSNSCFVLDPALSFVSEYSVTEHDPQRGEQYVI